MSILRQMTIVVPFLTVEILLHLSLACSGEGQQPGIDHMVRCGHLISELTRWLYIARREISFQI